MVETIGSITGREINVIFLSQFTGLDHFRLSDF